MIQVQLLQSRKLYIIPIDRKEIFIMTNLKDSATDKINTIMEEKKVK